MTAGWWLVETGTALAAGSIIALMVAGGAVALGQLPASEPMAIERTIPEPAPVSWNETR